MLEFAERFPNHPADFSILYLGTTWLPRDLAPLLRIARRRRAPVVVNQDGVAYPGWAGDRVDELNRPLRKALFAADHIVYQSEFSQLSASLFLGEPDPAWHDGGPAAGPAAEPAPDVPSIPTRKSRWDTGAPAEEPTKDWI